MQEHITSLIREAANKSDHIDDVDHPRDTTWHLATLQSSVLVRVEHLENLEALSFAAELEVESDVEIPFEMLMNFNSLVDDTGVFVSLDGDGGPISIRRVITTRDVSAADIVAAVEATAPKVLSLGAILPDAASVPISEDPGEGSSEKGVFGADFAVFRG
ncbi:MAG: hypothetical protein AAGE61_00480 [Pseudomonadota bacterium]